jgi:hypothetical protein
MFFPDEKNVPMSFPAGTFESTFKPGSGGDCTPYKHRFPKIWVVLADCWTPYGKYKAPPPPPGDWPEDSRWNMIANFAGESYGGEDDPNDARYLVWEPR